MMAREASMETKEGKMRGIFPSLRAKPSFPFGPKYKREGDNAGCLTAIPIKRNRDHL